MYLRDEDLFVTKGVSIMAITFLPHSPSEWIVPEEEIEMMMRVLNKKNGGDLDGEIDIRVKNQFLRMETRGKRVYLDAMSRIGVDV